MEAGAVTAHPPPLLIKAVNHYHHYLYEAKFTMHTDHVALRWLKTLKNPKGQLTMAGKAGAIPLLDGTPLRKSAQ